MHHPYASEQIPPSCALHPHTEVPAELLLRFCRDIQRSDVLPDLPPVDSRSLAQRRAEHALLQLFFEVFQATLELLDALHAQIDQGLHVACPASAMEARSSILRSRGLL